MTQIPPYTRTRHSTARIMTTALLSMLPILALAAAAHGNAVLLRAGICIASAAAAEFICRGIFARDFSLHDMSAAVTGMILALILPTGTPIWLSGISSAFAIVVGKQVFGGLGKNVINPALAGLLLSCGVLYAIRPRSALLTPLEPSAVPGFFAKLHLPAKAAHFSEIPVLGFGQFDGALFLAPVILLIIILLWSRTVKWEIPAFAAAGALAAAYISYRFHFTAHSHIPSIAASGGFLFIVSMILSDPVTSPLSAGGRIVYGIISGIVIAAAWILTKNGYAALLSVLACNLLTPLFDRAFPRRRFR